jgi:hypothetical protein
MNTPIIENIIANKVPQKAILKNVDSRLLTPSVGGY